MKKLIAISGLVCLYGGLAFANGPAVDFDGRDGGNIMGPGIMRAIQIEVPPVADSLAVATETELKPELLSDLLRGCPQQAKGEFYKSLFFANGGIASAKLESVRDCASKSAMEAITTTQSKGDGFGKDGFECKCNTSNQLNCEKNKKSVCQEVFCWGACSVKDRSGFGYVDTTRVFDLLPNTVAEEFIGGFTIQNGKIKKISVSEPVLNGLGIEKVAQIMETIMK